MNCKRSKLAMGTMLALSLLFSLPAWAIDINVTAGANKIQDAIAAASSGDTLHLAAGTYIESGQIIIDKDISIVSAVRPVIKPGTDIVGSTGDARGWWVVKANLNLSHVVIDGDSANGRQINIAILPVTGGSATITDCEFRNIKYSTYFGRGVASYGAPLTVTNSIFKNIGRIGMYVNGAVAGSFTGNTYYGKGVVDGLDYAIEVENGATATIQGNKISNCLATANSDGSTSAGILVTTAFNPGGTTAATITNNIFTDNSTAIAVGYGNTDTSVVVANYNSLVGNTDTAISNTSSTLTVNAQYNSWGTSNPAAIALMVYGLVDTSNPLEVGIVGPAGVTAVSAVTLSSGATATATLTGTSLALGIPQGPAGLNGTTPVKGTDYFDGQNGSPDTPAQVVAKIATGGNVAIGTAAAERPLVVDSANNTLAAGNSSFILQGQSNKERMEVRSFGTTGNFAPGFLGMGARGTKAAPTAVGSGDILFLLSGFGWNGTAYGGSNPAGNSGAASVIMNASETHSTTAKGSYIDFQTTANGTTSRATKVRIGNDGNVGIGTTAPTQKLEVNGGIRINTGAAKPACDTTTRGTIWITQGATDVVELCANVSGALAWKNIVLFP